MDVRITQKITAAEFASKYKGKKECFNFLTVACKAYLSSYETVTIYFLKGKYRLTPMTIRVDLVAGKKKFVPCNDVRYLFMPQYDNCSIKAILEQAANYPEVEHFLPDAKEHHYLPRQWLINVVHTVAGDDFAQWAMGQQDARNNRIATDNNLMIEMDPMILKCFQDSKQVSSKYCPRILSVSPSLNHFVDVCSGSRHGSSNAQGRQQTP